MRNQRKYIEGIVSVAAGHDSVAVEQVPGQNYAPERGFVWDVLRDFGLPHASALEEDLDRAYGGREPIYFAHKWRLADQFRRRLEIPKWSKHPECDRDSGASRCHVDLHEGVIRHVNDFQSATEEERQEAQKMREKERAMHDQARECVWCQRFRWEGVPEWAPETEAQPTGKDGLPF